MKSYELNPEEKDQRNRLNNAKNNPNDQASYHLIAFSYEPDIQFNISCKLIQIGAMDKGCSQCKAMKFKGETQGVCCVRGIVKVPELEQQKEPLKSLLNGITDNSNIS